MIPKVALLVAFALLVPAGGAIATPDGSAARQADAPPPRNYPEFTYERVRAEMRDGVELSLDIWRPVTPKGVDVPVILQLTPYHALYSAVDPRETDLPVGDARLFVPKGYAYAMADVRGTYNSGGCWNYGGRKERNDGYDLVEWLGTRDWSNGKVAMTGASYDGTTANAAAIEQPPHLATIVPISAISRWWGYAYQQGTRSTYSGESADADPPSDTPTDFMFAYGFAPPPTPGTVTSAQQMAMRWTLCNRAEKFLKGYDDEPDYDRFWKKRDYLRHADRVEVPVLVSHGQLDFNVKTWEGTSWFDAVDTEKAMVLGQWPHASPRSRYPEWDIFLEKWYERWLYGVDNGVEHEPAVRVQTNDKEWHEQDTWGPSSVRKLQLGGNDFSYFDDGLLTESEMLRTNQDDRFVRVKVPASSGVRISGRPLLHLSAKSDQTSTHFVAVLCDVGPSGSCSVISRAFMNARFRDSLEKPTDLKPGERYNFALEFIDKDHVVADDHHLEVIIASSSNTWVAPDTQRANNTLFLKDSWLELPIYAGN